MNRYRGAMTILDIYLAVVQRVGNGKRIRLRGVLCFEAKDNKSNMRDMQGPV